MEAGTALTGGYSLEELRVDRQDFPIWIVRPAAAGDIRAHALLSAEEAERAGRLRPVRLRRRYVAAHLALRELIARQFGIAPERQRFGGGGRGKPFLIGHPQVQWSLSYSGDQAAIALAAGAPIGIDLEVVRLIPEAEELIALHFSPAEAQRLRIEAANDQDLSCVFLNGWTRKEACVKALGVGIDMPLAEVESGCTYETEEVRIGRNRIRTSSYRCPNNRVIAWASCL